MKMRWIIAVVVLATLIFVVWQERQSSGEPGLRALTTYWQTIFLNRDAATAYSLFLQEGARMSTERSHTVSHVIGAVLYDRYGLDGLRYCTDDFNFGCYHGFAGRVIEERGPSGVNELMAACDDRRPMNCQHGVGHGLMAYMGNDHLNDAIVYCPTLKSGPCTTGIFMEYFLNTINLSEDRRILSFDPTDPTGPCDVVTEARYMGACHYNLPKLWLATTTKTTQDIPERFAVVARYCERVRDREYRASCFAGTGALAAPFVRFDEQATMALCESMPRDGREPCKTEALHALEQNKLRTHDMKFNVRAMLVLTATVLLLIVLGVLMRVRDDRDPGYPELTTRWQAVFLNRDAATAYRLFLQESETMPQNRIHTLSHIIGAILYDRYGLDGLRYCTIDFNYGCFHGFAGRVIEEQGPAGIAPLLAACPHSRVESCQHGIGHGIMTYMGDDHLNDALTYCPVDSSGPCTSGIFMEYFLNAMSRSDDHGIIPFSPDDPTGPCRVVSDMRYMGACYFTLPKLWQSWISPTTPDIIEQFALVGTYCERSRDAELRRACFVGVGRIAVPFSNFDEQVVSRICEAMPEDGRDTCNTRATEDFRIRNAATNI